MNDPRAKAALPPELPRETAVREPNVSFGFVAALFLLVALGFALSACAGGERPEPIIRTVEVQVPVDDPACARAAVAQLGETPAYPDAPAALQAAADLFERVKLLLAGRELRDAREAALTDALKACASEPTPSPR